MSELRMKLIHEINKSKSFRWTHSSATYTWAVFQGLDLTWFDEISKEERGALTLQFEHRNTELRCNLLLGPPTANLRHSQMRARLLDFVDPSRREGRWISLLNLSSLVRTKPPSEALAIVKSTLDHLVEGGVPLWSRSNSRISDSDWKGFLGYIKIISSELTSNRNSSMIQTAINTGTKSEVIESLKKDITELLNLAKAIQERIDEL